MNWGEEPRPDEPKGLQRHQPAGSTTLKQCGWCKYASGSHRFNYCIEGSCQLYLLNTYDETKLDVKWTDECKLIKLTTPEIDRIIRDWEYLGRSYRSRAERAEENRRIVESSEVFAKCQYLPKVPRLGGYFEFKEGEHVAVMRNNHWEVAVIVPGYRTGDGCVSWVHKSDETEAGCGAGTPCVIPEATYEWLRVNPESQKVWISLNEDYEYNDDKIHVPPIVEDIFHDRRA